MQKKSTRVICDSQGSPECPALSPRREGFLTLTLTGFQAAKLLKADPDDDQFAYFCPGCLRPLSMCSCPIDER